MIRTLYRHRSGTILTELTKEQLVGAIRDRGVTVVLIEHNMKLVMGLCDRISVLDFGRKIAAYLGRSASAGV